MPAYTYIAKSFDGKTKTGILDAKNESQVAQSLKAEGMILVKIISGQEKSLSRFNISIPLFGVSATEKIMMTRNLGVMFSTGLSMVKTFDILSVQAKNKVLKAALLDIKEKINKGENLSDALEKYPKIFSELFTNMIKVGEESGTLDDIFQILSLQLSKEHDLKSKIKNAMIYPSLILMTMFIIGAVIITIVLPSLNIFFTSLSVDVPIYTRILLDSGAFLAIHWWLLIVGPIALFLALWLTLKTKKGKWVADTFLLKLPLISPIVKKNNSAFLVRSLSSLIASGVPLLRAMEISSKTVGNYYFKKAIVEAGVKIKAGEKLSNALKPYQAIFPFGVIEMMEVGEETGKTADILKKLADFYEQEAIVAVEKLTTLLEPILIIVLGLAVGFFAFSIIQPMYSSLKFINE
ncbi:MAG: type II secretion system F family protein [bacterium]|nr:type II secretion system F family protein [bacterium]